MAIPTVVGAGTLASGTGDVSPGLPSGWAVNDVHFLFIATANETVSGPSGWTQVTNSPQGTGTAGGSSAIGLAVYWRRAESGDTAPTVTDPGDHCAARILGIRGCPTTGSPVDVSSGDVEATAIDTCTFSGVTTTAPNTLLIHACARATEASGAYTFTPSNGSLASFSEQFKNAWADGNGGTFSIWTATKATAGATGDSTGTWFRPAFDMSDFQALMLIAVLGQDVGSGSASFNFTAAAGGISDRAGSGSASFNFTAAGVAGAVGSGSASFNFTAAAGGISDRAGSGSASFNLTAAAGGTADKIGSGSASFSFTAAAGGAADTAGSGSASFTFAAEGIPKLEGSGTLAQTLDNLTYTITGTLPIVGELFQALTDLSTTITADLDKFGSVAKTLEDLTLEGTGYTITLTGSVTATLEFLETATEGTILGVQGASRAGVFAGTLADVAISSSGEREGVGDVFTTLDELTTEIIGLISLTREGAVTATLENVSPEGTGGVGFGAVLAAGLRPGNLQNLEWYITGQTETHGSVTGTLDGLTTGITGTGTDAAVYVTNTPAGPGVVGNRYDGLIWEAPVSHWQSLCSNTLEPRSGNPIAGCVICVTPIAMP